MFKNLFIVFILLFFNNIISSQNWVQISDFPATERDDGLSFEIGNKAYCGTGFKTGWITCRDMYSFDMNTETWDTIAPLPLGMERQYATGFSYNNLGFVFGGINGSSYLNDLWMYDTATGNWQNKASLPGLGRMGMCNFVINDTAYIIGGRTAIASAISEIWAYSIIYDTWTFKGSLPFGERWRASATAANSKGYLIFGKDLANNYRRELYEFNPISNLWILISNFPNAGRVYSTLQSYNNVLIVVAGLDSNSYSYRDLWRFDLVSSSWLQLTSIPAIERRGGMCFANNTTLYYTTGIDQTDLRLKQTWKIFNPNSVTDFSTLSTFNIFPNPATNLIYIEFESLISNTWIIEITNSLGQVVNRFNYESIYNWNNKVEIDLNSFMKGIYFVQLQNKDHFIVKKFIKK